MLDQWRFFRQWVRAPRETASIIPSSRALARHMVGSAGVALKSVVELGAGTGVFTRELIARGLPEDHLLVVELSADMAEHLREEFPRAEVHNADARQLVELVDSSVNLNVGAVDAVICGLGFLSMPEEISRDILRAVFAVLKPGGRLVTFTYGRRPSIPEGLQQELQLRCSNGGRTWINIPPARVFVYQRAND
jgi:phosphatidylethanolamine/phosphatidyl-N-methylethanolamine N-methyltransferase